MKGPKPQPIVALARADQVTARGLTHYLVVLIWCLVAWSGPLDAAEPSFPSLTGRVVDEAGIIPDDDERKLSGELAVLEEKSSDQLVVVTLKSLQGYAIEDYGYRLGRHWGIGYKGADNGVLLIVAPNERKVRIEVGRGLEGILTDALSKLIIENAIVPRFRKGDFPGGIEAGVGHIKSVLLGDSAAVRDRLARSQDALSGWAAWLIFLGIWVALIVFLVLMVVVIYWLTQSATATGKNKGWDGGDRSRDDPGSWGGSSGGWSSGGGGFSGGGGGFGGGGASGGW